VTDQKKLASQLSALYGRMCEEDSGWTAHDVDVLVDWFVWCGAWGTRLVGLATLRSNPFRGGQLLFYASAADMFASIIRASAAALWTTEKVIALQHDVMIAEMLVFESVVGKSE
jgi:hypothetical protein